jgi:Mg-chelatase subunit ChlD
VIKIQQKLAMLLSVALVTAALSAQEVVPVKEAGSAKSGVAAPAAPSTAKKDVDKPSAQPRVEVVFVLDTTGSMGGLIVAAKEKIWAIANTLATAKPAPHIEMGLVGYRDRKDEYITKKTDLTIDLDEIYGKLMAFQAKGGGDGPESVNAALHEAVTQMKWSKDDATLRLIFLVGDAPPHMDYKDDVKYHTTCEIAARAGIFINTIQCGRMGGTEPIWREIAAKAEGRYFRVEQSGGRIVEATPFDERLAELSLKVDTTRLYYGDAKMQRAQVLRSTTTNSNKLKSSKRAQAQWAVYNASVAGCSNFLGHQELCADWKAGKVKIAELKKEHLPEKLRKMSNEDLEKLLKKNLETRVSIQKEIAELGKKRQGHLEKRLKEAGGKDKQPTLDLGIFECIKTQAALRNIKYEGGPKL